jgi:hypothetical protein
MNVLEVDRGEEKYEWIQGKKEHGFNVLIVVIYI